MQGFLQTVIARGSIGHVERDGRRFRSWLLGGFTHHLTNIYRHDQRQRRGGGSVPISLDEAEAALTSDTALTPDEAYDARWARLILTAALTTLRTQQERTGKGPAYAVLEPVVTAQADTPHRDLAATLHLSEQAVTLQVHRLRRRLRDLVRTEVARTVSTPEEVDPEMAWLLSVCQRA